MSREGTKGHKAAKVLPHDKLASTSVGHPSRRKRSPETGSESGKAFVTAGDRLSNRKGRLLERPTSQEFVGDRHGYGT